MNVLKEIRRNMTLEDKYYSKIKVQNIIENNTFYMNYYYAIYEGLAKQTRPTSYETLTSNLYDVGYYMEYYCGNLLEQ